MNENNKPEKVIRAGAVSVSVWKKKLDNGNEVLNFTFSRSYKPEGSDEWKYSDSYGTDDILKMKQLIDEVYSSEVVKS